MTKEKRLGRGLEALLGRIPMATPPAAGTPPTATPPGTEPSSAGRLGDPIIVPFAGQASPSVQAMLGGLSAAPPVALPATAPAAEPLPPPSNRVPIARIDSNPHQPRKQFDEADMKALAESIQEHGLLQPVVVRKVQDRYQLVAGERRLRAASKAGWIDVPVQVVEADDRQMAELAIVENLQRKDLNALEKAASFQRYLEQYACTQEELATRLKIDRSTVANLIRLLELPEPVQDAVRRGKITQGHARALLPLGDEPEQMAFCHRIQREGLSVRQTEALVQQTIDQADAEPLAVVSREGETTPPKRPSNDHVAALEQEFRAALGLKVALKHNSRGRGKLVIQFRDHEEFQQLQQHICGTPRGKLKTQAG